MTATARPLPRGRGVRTRTGADYARVWVRQLSLRNPYAKSILLAVANYMNEDGAAWPGLATLSQDTDINEDTVMSRLRWCESIGLIVVLKCWVDEHGRRNYEKRGRPTSSEIRFLYDADVEAIEAAAKAEKAAVPLRGAAAASHANRGQETATNEGDVEPSDSDDSEFCPRPHGVQTDTTQHPVSTRLAPEQHPTPSVRILEPEQEDSPQPPASGGSEASDLEGWKEFQDAYPGPILRLSLAQTVWRALTAAERDLATRAAKGYALWLKAQRRPPNTLGAHLFLKERDAWPQYAGRGDIMAQRVSVAEDSSEALAFRNLRTAGGAAPPIVASDKTISLPHQLSPPELAFGSMPHRQKWQFVTDRNQIGAWLGFYDEVLQSIARRSIIEERNGERGLLTPWPWPPKKDGSTIPWPEKEDATAPPD